MVKKELLKEAKKQYANLPYHNYKHAIKTIKTAEILLKRCKKYKIKVNKEVVLYSLLFHDAGYHKKTNFKTKEDYSAYLAEKTLKRYNVKKSTITKVKSCIKSTRVQSSFKTAEEKIVRAADLAGMAGPYKEFLKNTLKLKKEYEILNNKKLSNKEWKIMTAKTISFYLSQDIRLTPQHDKEGMSVFHINTAKNLHRFLISY